MTAAADDGIVSLLRSVKYGLVGFFFSTGTELVLGNQPAGDVSS